MNWAGNPYDAGPIDADGYRHPEALRCLGVLTGEHRFSDVTLTDERLRVVAAVAESCRECGLAPTPDRLVAVIERTHPPARGARAFIRALLSDGAANQAARRRYQ